MPHDVVVFCANVVAINVFAISFTMPFFLCAPLYANPYHVLIVASLVMPFKLLKPLPREPNKMDMDLIE
jgi:hypothetical protein